MATARKGARRRTRRKAVHVRHADPLAGASTVSEGAASDQLRSGGPALGANRTGGPLDRVRADATGRRMTTNQGVPVADNQASLEAGLRGPTLLEGYFDRASAPPRV